MRHFLYGCVFFLGCTALSQASSSMDEGYESPSFEERTAILSRLIALNPNIPMEHHKEITFLAVERNRRAMDAVHGLKPRDVKGGIRDKQKQLVQKASSIFQEMGENLGIPEKDYLYILTCVGEGAPYLTSDALAKLFKDAKTPSDFMNTLPRLAYTALNAQYVGSDLTRDIKDGLAGDCFYFLTCYWDHHAQNLCTWMKDLQRLPLHRVYKEECDELSTMEGKRNTVSFLVDAVSSMEVCSKWAALRMQDNDLRKNVLRRIQSDCASHFDIMTSYVKNTVPQNPPLRELLSFGHGLVTYSKEMEILSQPLSRERLYFIFNELLCHLQTGVYDFIEKDPYPGLLWKTSRSPVLYNELREIAIKIVGENQHIYETQYKPLLNQLSKTFLRNSTKE